MKIRQTLSSIAIVLFVTAIVWVMADRSLLRTSNELAVKVQVTCDSPDYRVTVLRPEPPELHVKFIGPGRSIDQLQTDLSQAICRFSLSPAEAALAAQAGQKVFHVADGFAALAEKGIALDEAYLADVAVRVEAIRHIKVRVDLSPADKEQVDDGYDIDPKEVTATLPEPTAAQLAGQPWWAAPHLNLQSDRLLAGQVDTQTADLRASLPANELAEVTFEPPQVKVKKLRLTTFVAHKTIAEKIHVLVEGSPEIFEQYDVELETPEISNLKVVGPRADVDALKPEDVRAVLVLTVQDKPNPGAPIPRPLEIRFPSHDRLRVDGEVPSVNFNLKKQLPAPVK